MHVKVTLLLAAKILTYMLNPSPQGNILISEERLIQMQVSWNKFKEKVGILVEDGSHWKPCKHVGSTLKEG